MRTLADLTGGGFIALWAVIYLGLLVSVGLLTWRKGHWVLFAIGFVFPIVWVIGALLPDKRQDRPINPF
jgi:hypothetical protein